MKTTIEKGKAEIESQLAQAEYYSGHYDRAYGDECRVIRYRHRLDLVEEMQQRAADETVVSSTIPACCRHD